MREKNQKETFSKLLICLSSISESDKKENLKSFSPRDWKAVFEKAERQEILPLLYSIIRQQALSIPQDLLAQGERAFLKNSLRNSLLLAELKRILERFRDVGIPVILLKGASLANIYENLGLRAMGDIDLLVKEENLNKTNEELLLLGYEPDSFNPPMGGKEGNHLSYALARKGIYLEIHWRLFDALSYPLKIGVEEIWERAVKTSIEETTALMPSPEDSLLYLCAHIGAHMRAGDLTLRQLYDIPQLLKLYGEEIDWNIIKTRARQWKIAHLVYFVLRLAEELFKIKTSGNLLASFKPTDFKEEHLESAIELLSSPSLRRYHLYSLLTETLYSKGWRKKLKLIKNALFPSKERILARYRVPPSSPFVYLFYPIRLIDRGSYRLIELLNALWGLARGDKNAQIELEHKKRSIQLHDFLTRE